MLLQIMPVLLLVLKAGLWIFGSVFLLNGLSELFIDVVRMGRELWRRVVVFGYRKATPLSEADLLARPEQAVAVMIPCWDESAVIRRMLENSLKVLHDVSNSVRGLPPGHGRCLVGRGCLAQVSY